MPMEIYYTLSLHYAGWLYALMMYNMQIRAGKIEFFPLFRALALDEEVDETGKQLDELKTMVKRVLMRFEEEVR